MTHSCGFTAHTTEELRSHLKDHNLGYLEYPRVPEIIGPRLPDSSRLGNEDYADKSELYYRMVTLLYNPFRNLDAILDGSNSAKAHFDAWNPIEHAITARRLEYHQLYYNDLATAQKYRDKQKSGELNSSDTESDDDNLYLDDDVVQPGHGSERTRSTHEFGPVPEELYLEDVDVEVGDTDDVAMDSDDDLTPIQQLLLHSLQSTRLPPDETCKFTARDVPITRAQVTAFHNDVLTVVPTNEESFGTGTANPTQAVIVEAFDRAIRDVIYTEAVSTNRPIPPRASIREISCFFKLNRHQHSAFVLIAAPLLSKITNIPLTQRQLEIFNPAPLIITGAGGTGKSQIVQAVRRSVGPAQLRYGRSIYWNRCCQLEGMHYAQLRWTRYQLLKIAQAFPIANGCAATTMGPNSLRHCR